MRSDVAPPNAGVVLVAGGEEVFVRSLESVFAGAGYVVRRAFTRQSAVDQAHKSPPDAMVLGTDVSDPDCLAVCRTLRGDPRITPSTPIFVTQREPATRERRLNALRAGASDFWDEPLDAEEILLRLAAELRSKRDADHARRIGLIHERTGLYNDDGLRRRTRELLAEAARLQVALSLVVFGPDAVSDGTSALSDLLAMALLGAARDSDALARLDAGWIAVAAPATDVEGAVQLSERLLAVIDGALARAGAAAVHTHAGYETLLGLSRDRKTPEATPETLIERALHAFRKEPDSVRIQRWAP